VTLEVHQITTMVLVFCMPEMVLAATNHGRQRGKRRDVTAQVTTIRWIMLIGFDHHGHGIPADVATNLGFELHVARVANLLARGNGV